MAIKEPTQAHSSTDSPLLCTPSRRSSRLTPSVSHDVPGKMEQEIASHASVDNTLKRKRKYFQGQQKKKRVSKKPKLEPPAGNGEILAFVENCLVVDLIQEKDKIEVAVDLPTKTTPNLCPLYQSPKKRRVSANKVEVPPLEKFQFNPSDPDHIQSVKAALHLSTVPDAMICRDAEQGKVFEYCKDHLLQRRPGSLYICGCPGTGKSLLMEKVKMLASKWAEEGGLQSPEIISFNCTSLTNPNDIFAKIMQNISPERKKKKEKSSKLSGLKEVKHHVTKQVKDSSERMLFLIVDELDYLLGKDQTILHELFELPAQKDSRCILIGISNAIDLADRLLPSFSSLRCHPMVIPFSPYTKGQVISVIHQRIKVLPFPVFEPAALELCARKVAAASGDMRKALHVCRIAVDLLGSEYTEADEKAIGNDADDHSQLDTGKNKLESPLVKIHHMAQALAKTFRCAAVDIVKSLPKHQQMVLCAAVCLFREKKKDATLGQLNVGYVEFCKSTGMSAVSVPEFSSVCRVLADQGLLNLGSSREERLRRVTLQVDENDIVFALQAIRFFCNVLN